jgi:hypothetical protein
MLTAAIARGFFLRRVGKSAVFRKSRIVLR